jgi:hypothetical protein
MHTLLYYTANLKPEPFASKVREELLLSSLGSFPVVSVSQKPLSFGRNICIGEVGASTFNLYSQILIGVREVKTKWVVCCEDDTLYSPEHLFFTPPDDGIFYYNANRWTADKEKFWRRKRTCMNMCVVSTDLLRSTLEVRLKLYNDPKSSWIKYFSEPGKYEHHLNLPEPLYEMVELAPSLNFNCRPCLGGVRRLCPDDIVVEELPRWGSANSLWKAFVEL